MKHRQRDPTFWLEGPRPGGFQKPRLVGSSCSCGLLGLYHLPMLQSRLAQIPLQWLDIGCWVKPEARRLTLNCPRRKCRKPKPNVKERRPTQDPTFMETLFTTHGLKISSTWIIPAGSYRIFRTRRQPTPCFEELCQGAPRGSLCCPEKGSTGGGTSSASRKGIVAQNQNHGLLWLIYGYFGGIVAFSFGPLGVPDMWGSINRGPRNTPKQTMILLMGTPKNGARNCWKPHMRHGVLRHGQSSLYEHTKPYDRDVWRSYKSQLCSLECGTNAKRKEQQDLLVFLSGPHSTWVPEYDILDASHRTATPMALHETPKLGAGSCARIKVRTTRHRSARQPAGCTPPSS